MRDNDVLAKCGRIDTCCTLDCFERLLATANKYCLVSAVYEITGN